MIPGADLCPKGSWLSQQIRMFEQLNDLSVVGETRRSLDEEERQAILAGLQQKTSMTWPGVRRALAPLFKARGEAGEEKALKFNREEGGEKGLAGNAVEAKLAEIFGRDWQDHPNRQEIRDSVPLHLWQADYEKVGKQRVVILPQAEREIRRAEVMRDLAERYGLTDAQSSEIQALQFPPGWEPYSIEALQEILPHLEAGESFVDIVSGSEWAEWRNETFPGRKCPTHGILDRLPSPADPEESRRITGLRNPTAVRTHNELRKVVNNLIDLFGKPDLIRVSVTPDIGRSKRQREERQAVIRRQERLRKAARESLRENGVENPSRLQVEKWLLWEECGRQCPYTGDTITFDDLFRTERFLVEPIWPLSRTLDDSYRNRTLCRKDVCAKKRKPDTVRVLPRPTRGMGCRCESCLRNQDRKGRQGPACWGSSGGSFRLPFRMILPHGNSTTPVILPVRYWPASGNCGQLRIQGAPVRVHVISGRFVTQVRRLWGLNNILGQGSENTRADHRHHAIDALTVACCHPGMPQSLSRYWQEHGNSDSMPPRLALPWKTIRHDAERAVKGVIVSHRVRRRVSGPLHKETVYGDTGKQIGEDGNGANVRYFVRRKPVEELRNTDAERQHGFRIMDIVDSRVRDVVQTWVENHGGDPRTAFTEGYPRYGRNGPEIRKVRLHFRQQVSLMAQVSTGYAVLGSNHHIAIYRLPDGKAEFEVVSLLEASKRLKSGKPVIDRRDGDPDADIHDVPVDQ